MLWPIEEDSEIVGLRVASRNDGWMNGLDDWAVLQPDSKREALLDVQRHIRSLDHEHDPKLRQALSMIFNKRNWADQMAAADVVRHGLVAHVEYWCALPRFADDLPVPAPQGRVLEISDWRPSSQPQFLPWGLRIHNVCHVGEHVIVVQSNLREESEQDHRVVDM